MNSLYKFHMKNVNYFKILINFVQSYTQRVVQWSSLKKCPTQNFHRVAQNLPSAITFPQKSK